MARERFLQTCGPTRFRVQDTGLSVLLHDDDAHDDDDDDDDAGDHCAGDDVSRMSMPCLLPFPVHPTGVNLLV